MSIDEKLSMATEFLEHPQDSLVTGKLPVIVQCIVRNAIKTWLECSGKPREDTQREFSAVSVWIKFYNSLIKLPVSKR